MMNSVVANKRACWKISISTSSDAEEAVGELLSRKFGQNATSYTDVETGVTTVSVFLQKKPDWSNSARLILRSELDHLARCGLNPGPGRVSLSRVRAENWAESWKRHFPPRLILSRLLVKPPWSRRQPARDQVAVVINPGLSFGTGHHPTTQFCLEQVVAHRPSTTSKSFLDIGTGSGILAIAAAKLGYETVDAFDADPEAVRIARANARQNRTLQRIHFWQQDLARLPVRSSTRYSLVCANLISDVLRVERQRIVARVVEDGFLVLAGILKTEFPQVRHAFRESGFRLLSQRAKGEWCSGIFSRCT
jgi:ribosomal protein L11 methyltransferase